MENQTADRIKMCLGVTDEEAKSLAQDAHRAQEESKAQAREAIVARRMSLGFSRSASLNGIAECYEDQCKPYVSIEDIVESRKHPAIRSGNRWTGKGPGGTPAQSAQHFPYITGPFQSKSSGRKRSKARKA